MGSKQLIFAIFDSWTDADAAVSALRGWTTGPGAIRIQVLGTLASADAGRPTQDTQGTGGGNAGSSTDAILAAIAAVVDDHGPRTAQVDRHGLPDADRERIVGELAAGRGVVVAVVDAADGPAIATKLYDLGGSPGSYTLEAEAPPGTASFLPSDPGTFPGAEE